ncbi:MAG: hypothetical protein ACO3YQ_08095, partial [Flavobacteriales bacterium]
MKKFVHSARLGVAWILVALSVLSFAPLEQNTGGDQLLGVWEPSNGRARVKVERIGNKYYGRIVWL